MLYPPRSGSLFGVQVRLTVCPSALAARLVGAAGGVMSGMGKPATHVGGVAVGVSVPFGRPATELFATEPVFSFNPQRPIKPVPLVNSEFMLAWISACERATFQMRVSSITPAKKPAAAPADVMAVPMPACCRLSQRG